MGNNSGDVYLIMEEVQGAIDLWFPQIMPSVFNYVSCTINPDNAYNYGKDYNDEDIFLIIKIMVVWANNDDEEFHVQKIIPYIRWLKNWKQEIIAFGGELMWCVMTNTDVIE